MVTTTNTSSGFSLLNQNHLKQTLIHQSRLSWNKTNGTASKSSRLHRCTTRTSKCYRSAVKTSGSIKVYRILQQQELKFIGIVLSTDTIWNYSKSSGTSLNSTCRVRSGNVIISSKSKSCTFRSTDSSRSTTNIELRAQNCANKIGINHTQWI